MIYSLKTLQKCNLKFQRDSIGTEAMFKERMNEFSKTDERYQLIGPRIIANIKNKKKKPPTPYIQANPSHNFENQIYRAHLKDSQRKKDIMNWELKYELQMNLNQK